MKNRRWIRKDRMYRFFGPDGQAIIFGAHGGTGMWAWGVWGSKSTTEGIEFSLARAKRMANTKLDELSAERKGESG